MNHSGLRPRLVAFLTAIVVSVGLLSLSSAPAWAAAGTITEFTIPTKGTPFDTMGAIAPYKRLGPNEPLKQRDKPVADDENDSG